MKEGIEKYIADNTVISVTGGGAGGQVVGMGDRLMHAKLDEFGITITIPLARSQHKARALLWKAIQMIIEESEQ